MLRAENSVLTHPLLIVESLCTQSETRSLFLKCIQQRNVNTLQQMSKAKHNCFFLSFSNHLNVKMLKV